MKKKRVNPQQPAMTMDSRPAPVPKQQAHSPSDSGTGSAQLLDLDCWPIHTPCQMAFPESLVLKRVCKLEEVVCFFKCADTSARPHKSQRIIET